MRPPLRILLAGLLLACGCRSLDVRPSTGTSGRFRSEARAIRLLGWRVPRPAYAVALEVASDRNLPNARVTRTVAYPDFFFPFSWLNWILGFEGAIVEGEYGNPP